MGKQAMSLEFSFSVSLHTQSILVPSRIKCPHNQKCKELGTDISDWDMEEGRRKNLISSFVLIPSVNI